MLGRLWALFLLGSALLWTLVKRPFQRRDPVERFESTYGAEGTVGVTPEEHAVLARPGGCTACGRCDSAAWPDGLPSEQDSIMRFVLAGARSLPDYDVGRSFLERLSAEQLELGQRACPYEVPIVSLARLVNDHARRREGRDEGQRTSRS